MQLAQKQNLPVTQQQAWEALNDVALLQRAIPGCESITDAGDRAYDLAMTAAIGPVKARFKGKLRMLNLRPPESYDLAFDGSGGAAGHGQGVASVALLGQDDGTTVLSYSVEAKVGGKIAQIGSRLVDMAAQKLAKEFFERFELLLSERYPSNPAAPVDGTPTAPPLPPVKASLWGRLLRWLGIQAKERTS